MTVSFLTSTYTGQIDLLSALNTFVSGAGNAQWGVDSLGADDGSAVDDRLTLKFDTSAAPSMHFSIVTRVNGFNGRPYMLFAAHVGVNTSTGFNNQPGGYLQTGGSQHELISTPNTVADGGSGTSTDIGNFWFFLDDLYLVVVLEPQQGVGFFQHMFLGKIDVFNGLSNGYYSAGAAAEDRQAEGVFDNVTIGTGDVPRSAFHFASFRGQTFDTGFAHMYKNNATWNKVNNSAAGGSGIHNSHHIGTSSSFETLGTKNVFKPLWTINPAHQVVPFMDTEFTEEHEIVANKHAPFGKNPVGLYIGNNSIFGEASSIFIGLDEYLIFPAIKTSRIFHIFQNVAAIYRKSP